MRSSRQFTFSHEVTLKSGGVEVFYRDPATNRLVYFTMTPPARAESSPRKEIGEKRERPLKSGKAL